jgi:hypothetical protein
MINIAENVLEGCADMEGMREMIMTATVVIVVVVIVHGGLDKGDAAK